MAMTFEDYLSELSEEDFLSLIDNTTLPEETGITMMQAKAIIKHNNRSIYASVNDALKLGYLIAKKEYERNDCPMNNSNLIDLSTEISECDLNIEKAKMIIGDILDKYSFRVGGSLEDDKRKDISIDADRVMTYLFIVFDYIVSTNKHLNLMQDMIVLSEKKVTL